MVGAWALQGGGRHGRQWLSWWSLALSWSFKGGRRHCGASARTSSSALRRSSTLDLGTWALGGGSGSLCWRWALASLLLYWLPQRLCSQLSCSASLRLLGGLDLLLLGGLALGERSRSQRSSQRPQHDWRSDSLASAAFVTSSLTNFATRVVSIVSSSP